MDREKGLVCSLTNEWANFDPSCPDFKLEYKEVEENQTRHTHYVAAKKEKNQRELISAQIIMGLITFFHFIPLVIAIIDRFRPKVVLVSLVLIALYGLCVGFVRKAPLLCTIFMLSMFFIGLILKIADSGSLTRALDLVEFIMLMGLVYCIPLVNGNITQSYKS